MTLVSGLAAIGPAPSEGNPVVKAKAGTPAKDKLALVFASDFDSVMEDPEPGDQKRKTWLEILEAPAADDLMISMRTIFSITYRHDLDDDAEQKMLADIRKLATDALAPLGDILRKLRLKPVSTDKKDDGVKLFKYVVVNIRDISRRVTVEDTGDKARVIDVIPSAPADRLITNLRRVLSLTFEEVFSRMDLRRLLWQIRRLAAEALVPLNTQLEEIEVEPVGMPTLPFDEDSYCEHHEGEEAE